MTLRPEVVELRYGTPEHDRVREAIRQRREMSRQKMADRYSKWSDMEDRAQAYITPTENDSRRDAERKAGKPQYTTIEIPYSFAMLLTAHTYWTSVFLSRNPVFQYDGRHGETQQKTLALEAVIDYQLTVGDWLVPLYIWLMDMGKYGIGVIGNYWADDYAITSVTKDVPVSYLGLEVPGKFKKVRETIRIPGYSGNKLYNVRPQDFFPDPRVSIARFQEGEFCGRRTELGFNTILRRATDGVYFNLEAVKRNMEKWGMKREDGSSRLILPDPMETFYNSSAGNSDTKRAKSFLEVFELTVELSPQEWGLGKSDYPEKWVFSLINDEVVVGAQPQGLYHDSFAFDVIEYEVEGYALAKRSMLEILDPLNTTLSWLFNSHMHNVRKTINDQLVVDPSRVVMKDLTDPNAGRLVRLKPEAYGTDPKLAVNQLQTVDITRSHMQDALVVIDMMQRLTGVVDNVMGQVNSGGRKTATEVRTSSSFGVNRLKTACEYASAMGFSPLSRKLVSNTQQRYDGEKQFKIAGDLIRQKTPVMVTPDMIAGQFDYVPIDGTMPIDRFAQASLWKELMMLFLKAPQLAQSYDVPGIMGLVAQLSGVKNLDQYRLQAVPDQQVANGVQAGNLVPLKGGIGDGAGATGGARDFTQVPQTGSIAGVGRAA